MVRRAILNPDMDIGALESAFEDIKRSNQGDDSEFEDK